jgi:hypothetical protein
MSPYVKSLSKETGKSEKEIEKLWDKAKKIAAEEFGTSEDKFSTKEYKYVTGVVKKMLGIDEAILDPSHFLESEKSAKEYLETVVSSNFTIGDVNVPDEEPIDSTEGKDLEVTESPESSLDASQELEMKNEEEIVDSPVEPVDPMADPEDDDDTVEKLDAMMDEIL